MPKIKKNGLAQIVRFRAQSVTYTAFTGTLNGDALPGAILVFSEAKTTGWTDTPINTPSAVWSATVGIWEATIPQSVITQNGDAELHISGTGMIPVTIPIEVGNAGGGGGMEVITITTHNTSTKQIDTGDTTITAARIALIQDLTLGSVIYDQRNPRANKLSDNLSGFDISVSDGVITYYYKNSSIRNTDEIRIEVNPAA